MRKELGRGQPTGSWFGKVAWGCVLFLILFCLTIPTRHGGLSFMLSLNQLFSISKHGTMNQIDTTRGV